MAPAICGILTAVLAGGLMFACSGGHFVPAQLVPLLLLVVVVAFLFGASHFGGGDDIPTSQEGV